MAGVNASLERGALGGLDMILDVVLDEDKYDVLDVDDTRGGRDDVVVFVLISETEGVAAFFSGTIVFAVAFSIVCFSGMFFSVGASIEVFFSTMTGAAGGTVSEEDSSSFCVSCTVVCGNDSLMTSGIFSSSFFSSSTSILSSSGSSSSS